MFRLGVAGERQVDTVPYGCFRRELFDRVGYFDEELVRNQDDEHNGRIIRAGGRIMLLPQVVIDYYPRDGRASLADVSGIWTVQAVGQHQARCTGYGSAICPTAFCFCYARTSLSGHFLRICFLDMGRSLLRLCNRSGPCFG